MPKEKYEEKTIKKFSSLADVFESRFIHQEMNKENINDKDYTELKGK